MVIKMKNTNLFGGGETFSFAKLIIKPSNRTDLNKRDLNRIWGTIHRVFVVLETECLHSVCIPSSLYHQMQLLYVLKKQHSLSIPHTKLLANRYIETEEEAITFPIGLHHRSRSQGRRELQIQPQLLGNHSEQKCSIRTINYLQQKLANYTQKKFSKS